MTTPTARIVKCPTCNRSLAWTPENAWRPFCSERCKLIDLGDWFEERNRIPDESQPVLPGEDTSGSD